MNKYRRSRSFMIILKEVSRSVLCAKTRKKYDPKTFLRADQYAGKEFRTS